MTEPFPHNEQNCYPPGIWLANMVLNLPVADETRKPAKVCFHIPLAQNVPARSRQTQIQLDLVRIHIMCCALTAHSYRLIDWSFSLSDDTLMQYWCEIPLFEYLSHHLSSQFSLFSCHYFAVNQLSINCPILLWNGVCRMFSGGNSWQEVSSEPSRSREHNVALLMTLLQGFILINYQNNYQNNNP